ncbi:MAG: alpha/beta hydrolase [Lachnospiraceae bacterium]|nr:alpha/beta hydrolase [Candidatus Equihabitans merdae]
MENLVIYIHGQGGNIEEAKHYEALFPDSDVIGFDYQSEFPWDAKKEFAEFFDKVCSGYKSVTLVANSLGAFLAMSSLAEKKIDKAYFISPVVDMQKLILDMMTWANVSEDQLREKGIIDTAFGQQLSWKYLTYVRNNPITWRIPTAILYGDKDNLTSLETISNFADQTGASLTVMKDGEHWFHTEEQMAFLDQWIRDLK